MDTETTIYTIRHAHTAYNEEKRYAGTIDIPLNEKGRNDISKISGLLNEYHFDIVVTSPLKRAIETAELLFGSSLPLVKTNLCSERCFGVLEGLTWEDVQHLDPPVLFIEVGNDLHSVNPVGAEPFEDVWQRAKQFRDFLLENYPGLSILVISHGVFLQMFHGLLRGKSCIESLAEYPANLELVKFKLSGTRLVESVAEKLMHREDKKW